MDQVPDSGEEVLQPACFSHRDLPGVGIWSSNGRAWLLCAVCPSGKSINVHTVSFMFNSAFRFFLVLMICILEVVGILTSAFW